jgi:hypothetical protein
LGDHTISDGGARIILAQEYYPHGILFTGFTECVAALSA